MTFDQALCELGADIQTIEQIEDRRIGQRKKIFDELCAAQGWLPTSLGDRGTERIGELLKAMGHPDIPLEQLAGFVAEYVG